MKDLFKDFECWFSEAPYKNLYIIPTIGIYLDKSQYINKIINIEISITFLVWTFHIEKYSKKHNSVD